MKTIDANWSSNSPSELKWTHIKSTEKLDARIFRIDEVHLKHPTLEKESDFYQIKSNDFVNIFAVTPDNKLVVIEQFRFGTMDTTLETPGGVVEQEEDPALSAARELMEETGFRGTEVVHLKSDHPNPAIMNNRIHYYLARDASLSGKQNMDPHEIINVALIDFLDFGELIIKGKVTHSLIVSGYFYARDWLIKNKILKVQV